MTAGFESSESTFFLTTVVHKFVALHLRESGRLGTTIASQEGDVFASSSPQRGARQRRSTVGRLGCQQQSTPRAVCTPAAIYGGRSGNLRGWCAHGLKSAGAPRSPWQFPGGGMLAHLQSTERRRVCQRQSTGRWCVPIAVYKGAACSESLYGRRCARQQRFTAEQRIRQQPLKAIYRGVASTSTPIRLSSPTRREFQFGTDCFLIFFFSGELFFCALYFDGLCWHHFWGQGFGPECFRSLLKKCFPPTNV